MKLKMVFIFLILVLIIGCSPKTATQPSQSSGVIEKLYASDPARQMLGKELSVFSFVDIVSGKTITSGDLKNKVVLINSFILGCPSCLQEIAKLNTLYDKYGDSVTIIQLDINPKDSAEKILEIKKELNGRDYVWTVAPEAGQALRMEGPDYTYIVKNGEVVYADSFVVPVERLERFVQEALQ